MKRLLIVVDMQNDFITGSLGSPQAQRILPNVRTRIGRYREKGDDIVFTRDTHNGDYLHTQEGRFLPVIHCTEGTPGHMIADGLEKNGDTILDKTSFGSLELAEFAAKGGYEEIELCGLCSDICVISNALILKAKLPETRIMVDASCCAGVTMESHEAALLSMRMCQVDVACREADDVQD